MCRLKITDQNDLFVPFYYPDLQIALAFNGEIYNWRELQPCFDRAWTSNCDAEVLAAAWRWKREECLSLFNGMWAFVLVDMAAGEIFAARDRAGLKPLFMAKHDETLYLTSEIKALPIALLEQPCADMDCLEFDVLRETPIRDVERIEPAHRLLLTGAADLERPRPRSVRWWSLPKEAAPIGRLEAEEELERLILDSVYLRGNSEVRGAIQLSGGLDSAIIQAACIRLGLEMPLYCVSFPELDNLSAARLAGMGQSVTEVTFTREEFFDTIPSVAHHLDTPATWSAVCLWHLARRISKDGAKIVLSGEGADELLGGYSRYRILHWIDRMQHDPRLAGYNPTIEYLLGEHTTILARLLNRSGSDTGWAWLRAQELVQTFDPGPARALPRRMATIEFHTTMQVLLRMGDRMAAAWSLENRCPFLDYRIMEFCARLPDSLLVDDSESKSILRNVGRRLKVHPSITEEKTKKGLAVPWAAWNPSTTLGSRGAWDRSAFSAIMNDAWRQSIQRHISCENL